MRLFRFFIVCALFLMSAVANADNNNTGGNTSGQTTQNSGNTSSKPKVKKPVVVIKEGGDNISNNTCGPRRASFFAPSCPLEVGIYEDEATLYFETMDAVTDVAYEISVEDDVLLAGNAELVEGLAEVGIASIGMGDFDIRVTVLGVTYVGTFTIEYAE